jgi:hypothetical protein
VLLTHHTRHIGQQGAQQLPQVLNVIMTQADRCALDLIPDRGQDAVEDEAVYVNDTIAVVKCQPANVSVPQAAEKADRQSHARR